MPPILIDGSFGEGGGQILRTSLGLSMLTGTPVRIYNIRAKREKPGLMRQHLAAVRAAAQVSNATVEGDALSSQALSFAPGKIQAGSYRFAVGSAGSTSLVLQTILPALLHAEAETAVELEGGTHNPLAPPFDFLADSFIPILRKMGAKIDARLECPGFYAAGGGKCRVTVAPAKLSPIEILDRGPVVRREVRATIAGLPRHIGEREVAGVARRLADWPRDAFVVDAIPDTCGPGNVLTARLEFEHVTAVVTAFGKKGLVAENVAENLVKQIRDYLATDAPVDEHLADQLLIPLAIARGGAFVTGPLSMHTRTNIEVIQKFLPVRFTLTEAGRGMHRVTVGGS